MTPHARFICRSCFKFIWIVTWTSMSTAGVASPMRDLENVRIFRLCCTQTLLLLNCAPTPLIPSNSSWSAYMGLILQLITFTPYWFSNTPPPLKNSSKLYPTIPLDLKTFWECSIYNMHLCLENIFGLKQSVTFILQHWFQYKYIV